MPKSKKRFILSDESLNSKGFFVRTAGIDLPDFKKNPLMYWMHGEADKNPHALPIGHWTDIQINNNVLSAVPVFDDSDTFAMQIYSKVEHGTIKAASISVEPVELDPNKANWKIGQTKPTVLKSKVDEASIVDRPSNGNALTMRLSDSRLSDKSNSFDNKQNHTAATISLVNNALHVGKITNEQADKLLMMPNDDKTVKTIGDIVKSEPVNKLQTLVGKYHPILISQASKSWDEIHRSVPGGINDLKKLAPELYKAKFFEKHGRMPGTMA